MGGGLCGKDSSTAEIMKQSEDQALKTLLKWTNEAIIAIKTLKQDMQRAPTLATPDYNKPFFLYVANRQNKYASAVLMQETCRGHKKQPIAYYSI